MKKRGFFIWKEQWFSICSKHGEFDPNCKLCNTGSWDNLFMLRISGFFHKHFYKIWFVWVNRPSSKELKRLQTWFPNAKQKPQSNFSYFLKFLKK